MKKISLILLTVYALMVLFSCRHTATSQDVTGVVIDATMNTIMLIDTAGDTVNVSTMDTNPSDVPGVLIGDSVQITYIKGKVGEVEVLKSLKLSIIRHSPYYYIAGTWTEPNPIKPDERQGFTLKEGGTASSIGMATLLFESWTMDNKQLILKSKSIGNHQTIETTDTLQVAKLDADSLILVDRAGEKIWKLARQK